MFENFMSHLEDEIKKINNENLSIPILPDKDGYIDRECKKCNFQFKVYENSDIKYCPRCKYKSIDNWETSEQLENSKEQALNYVTNKIENAIQKDVNNFNNNQNNEFINIKMSYEISNNKFFIVSILAKEEMQQKIICKKCNTKYAIIGSAFFCPSCGHNSVIETFNNSIDKMKTNIKNIDFIKNDIEKQINKDDAEITYRSLIENSLSDGVSAFQIFCEITFKNNYPEIKTKLNDFQNLIRGGKHWKNKLGETYTDWLSEQEYIELNILFQKRHLIIHVGGIVDQKYIDNSNDDTYVIGQRIVINENDILKLIELINKLHTKIISFK